MRIIKTGLIAVALLCGTGLAQANERYYVITFCWEGNPPNPKLSHSFAWFVKTIGSGQDELEQLSISWLPATLNIKLIKRPEPGVNLGLRETFEFCKARGGEVLGLGPYEIRKDLYDRAKEQMQRLESGQVAYKAVDLRMKWRPGAANCYYAVTDAAPRELVHLGKAWGHATSVPMLEHYGPWLVNPSQTHDEIIDRIGLRARNVKFRRLQDVAPNSLLLQQTIAAPPVVR